MIDRRVAEAWFEAGLAFGHYVGGLDFLLGGNYPYSRSWHRIAESHADRALELLAEVEAERPERHPSGCVTTTSPTFVYLADGTKIVACRSPGARGRMWLEHREQAAVTACSGTGKRGG